MSRPHDPAPPQPNGSNGSKSTDTVVFVDLKHSRVPPAPFLGTCRNITDFREEQRLGEGTYGEVFRITDRVAAAAAAAALAASHAASSAPATSTTGSTSSAAASPIAPPPPSSSVSVATPSGATTARSTTAGPRYRRSTGHEFAVKRIRIDPTAGDGDGFSVPAYREIALLHELDHENVIALEDVVVGGPSDHIFMVMELCERDLAKILDQIPTVLPDAVVKNMTFQFLRGIQYLHAQMVIHRDLKLANLLLNRHGVLKIADFGLARRYPFPIVPMTPKVVTLWYRAPELLLGATTYSTAVDMWSTGCVFGELLLKQPIMPGKEEVEQLHLIFRLLGLPSSLQWPTWRDLPNAHLINDSEYSGPPAIHARYANVSQLARDLLSRLLWYNPDVRFTATEALNHRYFATGGRPPAEAFRPDDLLAFEPLAAILKQAQSGQRVSRVSHGASKRKHEEM
ncbi:kinase-like domain-containing protein [Blastocladiella britannica]|nr:kinase-like domain-containing protein [Blastocladiella britannica]